MWLKHINHHLQIDNTKKLALITFFANLYFYNHIGTLYAQTRGLNLLQCTSIWSIIVGTVFLAEVPTGVIADRIGRKWSVVTALLLQTLGEVWYLFARSYFVFVFIGILAGIGYAFSSGAEEALIYDTLPQEDKETTMKKAMGLVGGSCQLAYFLAALIGGLIVSELVMSKFLLVIFLTACSVALAFLISLTLQEPQKPYAHSEESSLTILKEGIGQLRHNRKLQWIVAIVVLTMSFSSSLHSLYQPYFARAQVPSFWIGASLSLTGLLGFFTLKYAYLLEEKMSKRFGLFIAIILPGLMYLVLAALSHPNVLIPTFIIAYASLGLRNPLLSSYQNQQIKSKNRATVLSLINMFSRLYEAIMGLVFGKIADYSISLSFFVIGVLIILFSVILRVDKLAVQLYQKDY